MNDELTVLLPYFNEREWLGRTVDSLVNQSDSRFRLILIDNASTDGSETEAHAKVAALGERVQFLQVAQPGKTHALAAALRHVQTPYVATCDADTIYPSGYVANILAAFAEDPEVVAVMAIDLYADANEAVSRRRIARILRKARKRPGHCHTGGYGQAFRTAALRAAGGFDPARWPYVLEDHEIIHRVLQFGKGRYAPDHYCHPSARRKDRRSVSWTWCERVVYHFTPRSAMDWFFHSFLARRLRERNGHSQALREKSWTDTNQD
jgi:glycosyltransferase involved in cell wall biosynthesis